MIKKIKFNSKFFTALFFVFCLIILAISLRGMAGNPDSLALNSPVWKDDGPLELSPERGRYALMYSVMEDKSMSFSLPIAKFATPDLGLAGDKFVSLFAPGISYLIIPGYEIGKMFNLSQVGAFFIITLFALFNAILVRAIAISLGAKKIAATIAAAIFLFATPAYAYAVSLYQHHVSVFLILLSLYLLSRWPNKFWSLALVWFLTAAAIPIDYPNLFLLFPIGIFSLGKIISLKKTEQKYILSVKYIKIATLLAMVLPIAFFLWFNWSSYGNPFQLSGTLPAVKAIDASGKPVNVPLPYDLEAVTKKDLPEKNAIGFFRTRNLLNGFYELIISEDRGITNFTPVILFGLAGLYLLVKKRSLLATTLVAVVGMNVLLYAMWGDPYGGWAFGARYLIPSYALLAIGLAIMLTEWRYQYLLLIVFLYFASQSVWINSLGAITTSKNPPKIEVLGLEKITGHEEKYTYDRNWQYLTTTGSKSFVYNTYLKDKISPIKFHNVISVSVSGLIITLTALLYLTKNKKNERLF
ncbi:MAG: hypothetical protein PHW95_01330 [Patescibacteria group bacterium]|nr:hypothetical protein [Patescibacteria group bacterium]